jgi:hypothetical protein
MLPVLVGTTVCGGILVGTVWEAARLRVLRWRATPAPEADTSPVAREPAAS